MHDEVPTVRTPSGPYACVLFAMAAAVLLSGCGGGTAAERTAAGPTSTTAAACRTLPPGHLPHAAGALTQADTHTYCLPVGGQVDVFLSVALTQAHSGRWSPVRTTSTKVLAPMSNGVLTPPVNVTPAIFLGATPGAATLSSQLPDGRTWRATIIVR